MGGGLLTASHSKRKSYGEIFEDVWPTYLSYGMSYDEYWNGPADRVIAYRLADEIKKTRKNQEMWTLGLYIYEALCDVAPVLRAFAAKDTKPIPYRDEPFPLTLKEAKAQEARREREEAKRQQDRFRAMVEAFNRKFEKREATDNG